MKIVRLPLVRLPLVVFLAITLHVVWALLLALDMRVGGITALAILGGGLFWHHASSVLCASSVLALMAILTKSGTLRCLLLLPQQFLLMISAAGALVAMFLGQYADGVMRGTLFIVADQIYLPILAVAHAVAIALIAIEEN